jgi:hypothetical protein
MMGLYNEHRCESWLSGPEFTVLNEAMRTSDETQSGPLSL